MTVSHKLANEMREIAQRLYDKTGPSAVYEYGDKINAEYGYCVGCDGDTPTIKTETLNECMICGQPNKEWVVTDPDCNQVRAELGQGLFYFREDRIIDPATGDTYPYESKINLAHYTRDQMFDAVQSFGYSEGDFNKWLDRGENLDLIAECIFETES